MPFTSRRGVRGSLTTRTVGNVPWWRWRWMLRRPPLLSPHRHRRGPRLERRLSLPLCRRHPRTPPRAWEQEL